MKKVLAMVLVLAGTVNAKADGWVCDSVEGDLRVKAYNSTDSDTRSAAILILSNPLVGSGRKTIATFSDAQGLLGNKGANYAAKVDLRFNTSDRKGELVGPTKLGELDQVILEVDFKYSAPIQNGAVTDGTIVLVKRNGDVIEIAAECERYLKGE